MSLRGWKESWCGRNDGRFCGFATVLFLTWLVFTQLSLICNEIKWLSSTFFFFPTFPLSLSSSTKYSNQWAIICTITFLGTLQDMEMSSVSQEVSYSHNCPGQQELLKCFSLKNMILAHCESASLSFSMHILIHISIVIYQKDFGTWSPCLVHAVVDYQNVTQVQAAQESSTGN